jgi:hypothetical protein
MPSNRYNLLTGLMVSGLLFSLVFGSINVKFNRSMIKRFMGQEHIIREADLISDFDNFYAYEFPQGNLFMHFRELNADLHGSFIMVHYFRASYILYPRRVFVVRDNPVIREMKEVLDNNDIPPVSWLKDHDVRNILTLYYANGRHYNEITRLQAEH